MKITLSEPLKILNGFDADYFFGTGGLCQAEGVTVDGLNVFAHHKRGCFTVCIAPDVGGDALAERATVDIDLGGDGRDFTEAKWDELIEAYFEVKS